MTTLPDSARPGQTRQGQAGNAALPAVLEHPTEFPHEPDLVSPDTRVVSTGNLPDPVQVREILAGTYERYRDVQDGRVADYIPALAEADSSWFGLSLTSATGQRFSFGDAQLRFSIQSISKAFVYALVVQELGHVEVRERIGVNNTGLPFNSVMAIELNGGRTMNPLVNAGALATTSLVPGKTWDEKWDFIHEGLSKFAGHTLEIDERVYESEMETNTRNRGIARLLESYGHISLDPMQVTELYTRQCSLLVTAEDLATMGATLADGGDCPISGIDVVDPSVSRDVLSVMATNGMYEASGDWLFEVGMPGKSGVSGGIVAIAPGKGSLATFSPPLDAAGNSVRGIRASRHLSNKLGLNLFASTVQ